MKRIGVFGGSFNPPHFGHIRIAESALRYFALTEIRWVPAHVPPHKSGIPRAAAEDRLPMTILVAAEDRLQMTILAVADHPEFTVSDLEIERGGTSFTVDTLRAIRIENRDAELFLIIGEDNHVAFDTWKEPDSIVDLASLIVYPKSQFGGGAIHKWKDVNVLDAPLLPISSTLVRNRIHDGEFVEDLIPSRVADYIEVHRLYLPA